MKISFADLLRPAGTVDRGTYAVVGLLGFAIKHNPDRFVASDVFHRPAWQRSPVSGNAGSPSSAFYLGRHRVLTMKAAV